jgi:hypothetical protein
VATSTLAKPQSPASSTPESRDQTPDVPTVSWRIGEQPDPLKIALSGFPDVNTYRAYYEGVGNDF